MAFTLAYPPALVWASRALGLSPLMPYIQQGLCHIIIIVKIRDKCNNNRYIARGLNCSYIVKNNRKAVTFTVLPVFLPKNKAMALLMQAGLEEKDLAVNIAYFPGIPTITTILFIVPAGKQIPPALFKRRLLVVVLCMLRPSFYLKVLYRIIKRVFVLVVDKV